MTRTASPQSMTALGRRVADARRSKGWSQRTLAATVGLDRTALSKIESGRRNVGGLELARLARALELSIEQLLSGESGARTDLLRLLRRKRRAILRIAARHGARSVSVFGSVARREERAGSDLDLLVDLEPDRSLFDQAAILVEVRALLGREVDVVTPQGLRDRIRDRVLNEAVPL